MRGRFACSRVHGDEHEEDTDAGRECGGGESFIFRVGEQPRGADDAHDKERETSTREHIGAPSGGFRRRGEIGGARLVPAYDVAVVVRDQVLSSFSDW